jgi:hypothetical protein
MTFAQNIELSVLAVKEKIYCVALRTETILLVKTL